MQFSFEYFIVPKVHKTEEDVKASAVYLNHQDICSDSPNRMETLDGSVNKMEGDQLKIETVAALIVLMPTHFLYTKMCDLRQINLRCTPQEYQ